MNDLIHL